MNELNNDGGGLKEYVPSCTEGSGLHVSFAGGAIQSFFNVGVASWMIRNMKRDELGMIYGISGGALCGAWLLCASDAAGFELTTNQYIKEWEEKVDRLGGRMALRRSLGYHRSLLERYLPKDAHKRCSGRLTVGMTNVKTRRLDSVSHFETREFLIDVLIATMTIPLVNACMPSKVNGRRYVDGGFVSNQIVCCEEVLVCSPFRRLRMPWTNSGLSPRRSIRGGRPILQALNPYSDVRSQVREGVRFAQNYFDSPCLSSGASQLGSLQVLERLQLGEMEPTYSF